MSVDDLMTKEKPVETPAAEPKAPDDPKTEEKKGSPIKLLLVAAAVAVGAIFLRKKFKGKFPNHGDDPVIAP